MSLKLEEQYEKIYTFCYFKVYNREIAEDITQDTFLRYFDGAQYLEKGKKLAYLYIIARNLCIDYFRKSAVTIDQSVLSYNKADNLDTSIAVRIAVSRLSEEDQEMVLLRFTNELRIGEIAEYLGLSRFAVNRRLKTILKQLKVTLKEEDFYE